MKKSKKLLSVLLAAAMVLGLAGCSGAADSDRKSDSVQNTVESSGDESGEEKETAKGRFIESELKLPDGVTGVHAMTKLSDGSLEVVGYNDQTGTDYILTSDDEGENWQVKELENLQYSYLSHVAIANDGSIAFIGDFTDKDSTGEEEESNTFSEGLKLVSKEGEIRILDFALPDKEDTIPMEDNAEETYHVGNLVMQAAFDQEGNLVVQDLYSTLYKMDIQSGELTQLYESSDMDLFYFGIAGSRIYGITESGMKIISGTDGTVAPQDAVLDELAKANAEGSATPGYLPMVMAQGVEDNSVIYANHQGVFYHKENGSVSEQFISGELCSLSDNTLLLAGMVMLNEKSYLISAMDAIGNAKLLKYVYDADASSVPGKQLRVYALEESNLLRQIVTNFQAAHPDIFVKVEIGTSEDNGVTIEDALRTLNTDILAGKGPDILILDGMPAKSYKNKGILADIKGILEEIENTDGFFDNIKEIYEENNSIYYLPARFSIPVVEGSDEAAAAGSIEGLLSYAQSSKTEGSCVFPSMGAAGLLKELFQADSAGWFTKEGELDQEKLKKYLKTAKGMYDLDENDRAEEDEAMDIAYNLPGYNLGTVSAAAIGRMTKTNQIALGTISDLGNLRDLLSMEHEMGGTYDIYTRQEVKSFVPYLMAGIVKGSEEKQEVSEFMKLIYAKESGMLLDFGFPINKAAYQGVFDKMSKEDIENTGLVFSTEEGTTTGYNMIPLTKEMFDAMTQKIESLNGSSITDRVIYDLVMEEGSKYLEEEQSLEDTVSTIMQKVNLYLSE